MDGLPIKFGMLLLGRTLHSEPRFTHSSLKRETVLERGIFGARRVLRPEIEAEGRLRLADVVAPMRITSASQGESIIRWSCRLRQLTYCRWELERLPRWSYSPRKSWS